MISMAKFICNFISYTLKRTVDITVVIPSMTFPHACGDYESSAPGGGMGAVPRHYIEAKYPVIYLLHGLGNNHMTWNGYTNAELYAEEHMIALVMPSGENKGYTNQSGDAFYDFIDKELPEFVCSMFPISEKPQDTYMAGLSMGAIGTFIHGFRRPEKYRALGAFSGGIYLPPVSLSGEVWEAENNPEQLVHRLTEYGRALPDIFLACGRRDPLFEMCVRTREALVKNGFCVKWREEQDYAHEWRFWDKMLEEFMEWIPRTDAYAQFKERGRKI